MAKTFILGIGAQKAGTTWLHAYLKRQPEYNMGRMKEYHIWDSLTFNENKKFLISNFRKIFKKRGFIPYPSHRSYIRYKMQTSPGFYGKYFSNLIKGNVTATGDITPAYSVLSSDTFVSIKNQLEEMGFVVKVVFLLRDPFERCWSAVRMHIRNGKHCGEEQYALKNHFTTEGCIFRTNYKRTIEVIESVFDEKDIYYGIYEEMFLRERIEELSSFCGVNADFDFTSKKFNVSEKSVGVDEKLREEILNFYSDVYKFCNDRFPQTKVLWNKPCSIKSE